MRLTICLDAPNKAIKTVLPQRFSIAHVSFRVVISITETYWISPNRRATEQACTEVPL